MKLATLAGACVVLAASPALAADLRSLGPGTIEASGGTRVPGGEGALFVDDGQPGQVTWIRVGAGGEATLTVVPLGVDVVDPEGVTNDGTWVYVVGSQSRGGRQGASLARFRFDAKTGAVSEAETLGGLADLVARVVPEAKGRKKDGRLNIEGLAWDASGRRLLLGLRAPLDGRSALVVPLTLGDGALSAETVTVGAPLRLDLGGRGIRSIEQHPDGGFLVVAGHVSGAQDFALLAWDGTASPRPVVSLPDALKPEGVARIAMDGRDRTLVLGDSGHYTILD